MTEKSFNEIVKKKAKLYFIDALGAMAFGLFATLLVGTILNTIGKSFNIAFLTEVLWPLAQKATGPAIAVAIATAMSAPSLVVYAATVVGIAVTNLADQWEFTLPQFLPLNLENLSAEKQKLT